MLVNLATTIRAMEIFYMKNEPHFKARIGPRDLKLISSTCLNCSIEMGVLITIKDYPHLIAFRKLNSPRPCFTDGVSD